MEKNRYDKFLDELNADIRRRGITKSEIWKALGTSNKTVIDFLNGKSLSMSIMMRVIDYVDNQENWKK